MLFLGGSKGLNSQGECSVPKVCRGLMIRLEVFDKDIGKKDDFLGKCEIATGKVLTGGDRFTPGNLKSQAPRVGSRISGRVGCKILDHGWLLKKDRVHISNIFLRASFGRLQGN